MTNVVFTHKSLTKFRPLADKIKENLQPEVTGTVAKLTEKVEHHAFDSNLPEGITPKLVDELSKYHANFSRAQHIAVAEMSADIFNANPDIKAVTARVGIFAHGDFSDMTVEHSRVFPNNKAKEGEPPHTLKHLYVTESTTHKGESFKSLKNAISMEFKDKYVI